MVNLTQEDHDGRRHCNAEWTKRRRAVIIVALLLISAFVACVSTFIIVSTQQHSYEHPARRALAETGAQLLPPWAQYNLVDVKQRPSSAETPLFWHVPKSGGTTAKRLYECMGQTLANRLGADPRFGHDKQDEIVVFQPFSTAPDMKFVNVDTTTKPGILRAERLGLVPSRKADMIFSSDVNFASQHLFSPQYKGRIYAFFRNPVDRCVSKFYYLQTATWERTYRPEWVGMSITDWATNHNFDENFLVKKINGKGLADPVDEKDLVVAKEIVRRRFIVGLMSDMEESVRRFNIMLGIDRNTVKSKDCHNEYFGDSMPSKNTNSNSHPEVTPGSHEYDVIAERNALDMVLYKYIQFLYSEQRSMIDSYAV
mmetsp:Transcript_19320/g.45218  ORF Transcript_19320/g.45218 Transcript_19320/m.45218 type:complete len:369 (+) Transcript_19320:211-1317(+)